MNRNWMMIWPTTSRPPRFEQYLTQKKRVCPPQFLLDWGQLWSFDEQINSRREPNICSQFRQVAGKNGCCGIERLGNRSSEVSVGGLELQALNSKRRVASACCTAFVVQSCTVLCRRVIEECLFHLPRWQRQQPQREDLVPKQAGTLWRCCRAWWGMVIAWRFECFDFQCLSQTKKCICGPM